MRGHIHPDFEISLTVALKMVKPHLLRQFATAKLPHERDAGAQALAAAVLERLRLSGWEITKPPPVVSH